MLRYARGDFLAPSPFAGVHGATPRGGLKCLRYFREHLVSPRRRAAAEQGLRRQFAGKPQSLVRGLFRVNEKTKIRLLSSRSGLPCRFFLLFRLDAERRIPAIGEHPRHVDLSPRASLGGARHPEAGHVDPLDGDVPRALSTCGTHS